MTLRKIKLIFISILFLGTVFVWQAVFATAKPPFLEVNFFDVGQGDSVLIEMPGNNQILIDGGPSGEVLEKIAREMPFFDRKIEIIILTHPDKDHITGLFEVLDIYKIDRVFLPDIEHFKSKEKSILYENFKREIKEQGGEIIFGKRGQKISFSKDNNFLILWPPENLKIEDINDYSIVSLFSFGDIDFLFTGDISRRVEHQISMGGFDLESEVLKIAHHGSKYSTSEEFLNEVNPEIAVISVGKNPYGHPAKEVLDNLQKYDIRIYRTDEKGDIKIISNGKNYQIITEK